MKRDPPTDEEVSLLVGLAEAGVPVSTLCRIYPASHSTLHRLKHKRKERGASWSPLSRRARESGVRLAKGRLVLRASATTRRSLVTQAREGLALRLTSAKRPEAAAWDLLRPLLQLESREAVRARHTGAVGVHGDWVKQTSDVETAWTTLQEFYASEFLMVEFATEVFLDQRKEEWCVSLRDDSVADLNRILDPRAIPISVKPSFSKEMQRFLSTERDASWESDRPKRNPETYVLGQDDDEAIHLRDWSTSLDDEEYWLARIKEWTRSDRSDYRKIWSSVRFLEGRSRVLEMYARRYDRRLADRFMLALRDLLQLEYPASRVKVAADFWPSPDFARFSSGYDRLRRELDWLPEAEARGGD